MPESNVSKLLKKQPSALENLLGRPKRSALATLLDPTPAPAVTATDPSSTPEFPVTLGLHPEESTGSLDQVKFITAENLTPRQKQLAQQFPVSPIGATRNTQGLSPGDLDDLDTLDFVRQDETVDFEARERLRLSFPELQARGFRKPVPQVLRRMDQIRTDVALQSFESGEFNDLLTPIMEGVAERPTLQRVLGFPGKAISAVANVADAAVNAVQGEMDVAFDRLVSAGKQARDTLTDIPGALTRQVGLEISNVSDERDFRSGGDVLASAGIPEGPEFNLPLVGDVSTRGIAGVGTDFLMFDFFRFGRINKLTSAGLEAERLGTLAKAPFDTVTGKVGSRAGARVALGQQALLAIRKPFTDKTMTLIKGAGPVATLEMMKRSMARWPGVRAFGMSHGLPDIREHGQGGSGVGASRFRVAQKSLEDIVAASEEVAPARLLDAETGQLSKVGRQAFDEGVEKGGTNKAKRARIRALLDKRQALVSQIDDVDRKAFFAGAAPRKAARRLKRRAAKTPDGRLRQQLRARSNELRRTSEQKAKVVLARHGKAMRELVRDVQRVDVALGAVPEQTFLAHVGEAQKARARALIERYKKPGAFSETGFSTREAVEAAKASLVLGIDENLAPFAARYRRLLDDDILSVEIGMGVDIAHLADPALHYMTRVLTPEFLLELELSGKTVNFQQRFASWYGKNSSAKQRSVLYEGKTVNELNRWLEKQFPDFQGDRFIVDPRAQALTRARRLEGSVKRSELMRRTLEDYALEIADESMLVGKGGAFVPVAAKLKAMGLQTDSGPFARFANSAVPIEIVEALDDYIAKSRSPGAPNKFARFLDLAVRPFKTGVTVVSPGFNFRNMLSNKWMNFYADVEVKHYGGAAKLLADAGGANKLRWDLSDGRSLTSAEVMDLMRDYNALDFGAFSAPENIGGAVAKSTSREFGGFAERNFAAAVETVADNPAVRKFFGPLAKGIENHDKVAHFLDRMAKRVPVEQAMLSIKKFLFDYSDLTPFEKVVLRRLVPFYTFFRKNLPLQLETMVTSPGKVAMLNHIQNFWQHKTDGDPDTGMEGVTVPPYVAQRLHGFIRSGKGPNQVTQTVTGTGAAIEDLSVFDSENPLESFGSVVRPELKALAQSDQFGAGRDFFLERELSSSDRAPSVMRNWNLFPGGDSFLTSIAYRPTLDAKRNVNGYRANPTFLNAISGIPVLNAFSRVAGDVSRLFVDAPEGRENQNAIARTLFGVSIADVPPEVREIANRKLLLEEYLGRMEALNRVGIAGKAQGRFFIRRDPLPPPPVVAFFNKLSNDITRVKAEIKKHANLLRARKAMVLDRRGR